MEKCSCLLTQLYKLYIIKCKVLKTCKIRIFAVQLLLFKQFTLYALYLDNPFQRQLYNVYFLHINMSFLCHNTFYTLHIYTFFTLICHNMFWIPETLHRNNMFLLKYITNNFNNFVSMIWLELGVNMLVHVTYFEKGKKPFSNRVPN